MSGFWQTGIERLDLDPVTALLIAALVIGRLAWRSRERPQPRSRRRRADALAWYDAGLIAVLACFLVIRPFLVQITDVRSPAMAPTLRGGLTPQIDGLSDRVLVARYLPYLRPLRRGEVVQFQPASGHGGPVLGRVVALPGETVSVGAHGVVEVGGRPLHEPYLAGPGPLRLPACRVPAGMYFVLGDNRGERATSAWWFEEPFVPAARLRGKAVAVCWPPGRVGLLD